MVDIRAINGTTRPNTVVIFGDSITSNNTTTSGTTLRYDARGFFTVANSIMGWPLKIVNNAGVSGNTTTQMLARITTDVLAYNPGYVVYEGGRNDLFATSGDRTTSLANDQAMFALLKNAGIVVFVIPIFPSSDLTGDAYRSGFQQMNRARRLFCESNQGFYYCDIARAITDPATGLYITDTLYTDNLHPTPLGCMALGRALAETMSIVVPPNDTGVNSSLNCLNYAMNPFANGSNASGTAGFNATTVTGVGPNGWYTRVRNTGTAVSSKVSRSPATWRTDGMSQLAITCAADYDGAAYSVGGATELTTGRYDVSWAATTAYTYNSRVKPTVSNGYTYIVAPGGAGTSAGSQPTWPTEEGAQVVDGTVTWMCQRMPTAGDTFFAECDLQFSSLAGGWACPTLQMSFVDTSGATSASGYANYIDLSGLHGKGFNYLPPTMKLRTPTVTMPSMTLRYLRATIYGYGQNGATFNMGVGRFTIQRVSP